MPVFDFIHEEDISDSEFEDQKDRFYVLFTNAEDRVHYVASYADLDRVFRERWRPCAVDGNKSAVYLNPVSNIPLTGEEKERFKQGYLLFVEKFGVPEAIPLEYETYKARYNPYDTDEGKFIAQQNWIDMYREEEAYILAHRGSPAPESAAWNCVRNSEGKAVDIYGIELDTLPGSMIRKVECAPRLVSRKWGFHEMSYESIINRTDGAHSVYRSLGLAQCPYTFQLFNPDSGRISLNRRHGLTITVVLPESKESVTIPLLLSPGEKLRPMGPNAATVMYTMRRSVNNQNSCTFMITHHVPDDETVFHRDDDKAAYIEIFVQTAPNKPKLISTTEVFYAYGTKHRGGDKPAMACYNEINQLEYAEYWFNGERHRDGDGPAVVSQMWLGNRCLPIRYVYYVHDEKHRFADKPAMSVFNYTAKIPTREDTYYRNGVVHRETGPARIRYQMIDGEYRATHTQYIMDGQPRHYADGPIDVTYLFVAGEPRPVREIYLRTDSSKPTVVGYRWINRANRVIYERYDEIGHSLIVRYRYVDHEMRIVHVSTK